MTEIRTWRERAQNKRRKAAVERAVTYLNEGLAGLAHVRKGTAEKRVRGSPQPMSTAKVLVKEWSNRAVRPACDPITLRQHRASDDRTALFRVAYAVELGHSWPAGDQAEAA